MKNFIVAVITLLMGIGLMGEEKGKKDLLKDLHIVNKTVPVSKDRIEGFESIKAHEAGVYIKFLSSDLLEGRDTGERGYEIAAEYAASMFRLWGLKPAGDMEKSGKRGFMFMGPKKKSKPTRTYSQNIELREILESKSSLTVSHSSGGMKESFTFDENKDYTYFTSKTHSLKGKMVFAGYGISEKKAGYEEYKKLNVKGKIVMILDGVPDIAAFKKGELRKKYLKKGRHMRRSISTKVAMAKKRGAAAIVLVSRNSIPRTTLDKMKIDDHKPIFSNKRRRLTLLNSSMKMPWETIPTIRVSEGVANEILKSTGKNLEALKALIKKSGKPSSMALSGTSIEISSKTRERLVGSRNVLGYIEGSDPELKKEVVIIGAHLDHLGKKGDYIFNGADDNGSGSAAVMELAQAFATNPIKPKRSVLFALWTGEELGLLGSRYYVNHPFFPHIKTQCYLNLDMVSRPWTKKRLTRVARMWRMNIPEDTMKKLDASKFMMLSLSLSSNLYDCLKNNNKHVGLSLYLRKTKSRMGGSDHAPFAYHNVPWVFFFASMTEDYHQPTDSFDKVDTKHVEHVTRLVYLTAFDMANKK